MHARLALFVVFLAACQLDRPGPRPVTATATEEASTPPPVAETPRETASEPAAPAQAVTETASVPAVPVEVADAEPSGVWLGVVASPTRRGVLTAWSRRHVLRTLDGGARWDSFGFRHGVRAVAIDDDGTLVVQHGVELRLIDRLGHARIVPSPQRAGSVQLAARGATVVVFGDDGLFVSGDGARTFAPALDGVWHGNFENALRLSRDGTLEVLAHTEAACGGGAEVLWRVAPGSAAEAIAVPGTGYVWGLALGAPHVALAIDEQPGSVLHLVAARRGEPGANEVAVLSSGLFYAAGNDEVTLIANEGRLYQIDPNGESRELAHDVPEGFSLSAVDAEGRALGVSKGRVVVREPSGVWRTVDAPVAD